MSFAKNVTVIASGALVAAAASFVPGTAEAHCGGHAGSCSGSQIFQGVYCNGSHEMWIMNVYNGFCSTPAPGCSGSGCLNWPCASGACNHGPNQCFLYSYDQDMGVTGNCGS